MELIAVECPHCRKTFNVPVDKKYATCPHCQTGMELLDSDDNNSGVSTSDKLIESSANDIPKSKDVSDTRPANKTIFNKESVMGSALGFLVGGCIYLMLPESTAAEIGKFIIYGLMIAGGFLGRFAGRIESSSKNPS